MVPIRFSEAGGNANIVSWLSASTSTSQDLEDLNSYFPDSFSAGVLHVIYLLSLKCTHVLSGIQREVEVILSGAVVTDEHAPTNTSFFSGQNSMLHCLMSDVSIGQLSCWQQFPDFWVIVESR